MDLPILTEGTAVLYPHTGSEKDSGRTHVLIVIDIDAIKGDIILVPICSHHQSCDETCILDIVDKWKPVRRKSYIGYYQMKRVSIKTIQIHLSSGWVTHLGNTPTSIYMRVRDGIMKSKETENRYLKFFREKAN